MKSLDQRRYARSFFRHARIFAGRGRWRCDRVRVAANIGRAGPARNWRTAPRKGAGLACASRASATTRRTEIGRSRNPNGTGGSAARQSAAGCRRAIAGRARAGGKHAACAAVCGCRIGAGRAAAGHKHTGARCNATQQCRSAARGNAASRCAPTRTTAARRERTAATAGRRRVASGQSAISRHRTAASCQCAASRNATGDDRRIAAGAAFDG